MNNSLNIIIATSNFMNDTDDKSTNIKLYIPIEQLFWVKADLQYAAIFSSKLKSNTFKIYCEGLSEIIDTTASRDGEKKPVWTIYRILSFNYLFAAKDALKRRSYILELLENQTGTIEIRIAELEELGIQKSVIEEQMKALRVVFHTMVKETMHSKISMEITSEDNEKYLFFNGVASSSMYLEHALDMFPRSYYRNNEKVMKQYDKLMEIKNELIQLPDFNEYKFGKHDRREHIFETLHLIKYTYFSLEKKASQLNEQTRMLSELYLAKEIASGLISKLNEIYDGLNYFKQ